MAPATATLTAAPELSAPRPDLSALAPERPVFLDESGRRARIVRIGGRLLGGATAAWLGALVLGASAAPPLPPLSVQLASMRGANATANAARLASAAAGHARGSHSPASELTFARLTVRPDVRVAAIVDEADGRGRAARRI